MVDVLYKLNNKLLNQNTDTKLKRKIRNGIFLLSLKLTNVVQPLIYSIQFNKYKLDDKEIKGKRGRKVIISLTSFPARIDFLWLCIESLFRQSVQPDRIILWLANSQFDGVESLPKRLLEQQKKGLIIKFCDDLRSHKKYFYSFKEYPSDVVITVDDDVFYPSNAIEKLIELHRIYPNAICCNRGHVIKLSKNNQIAPYEEWVNNNVKIEKPSLLLCPTGVGGVLYPPDSVHEEVFNEKNIKDLCFFADDIWLKFMSLKKRIKVVRSTDFPQALFTITPAQKESLAKINVDNGKNDEQLKNLIDYYYNWDIFSGIDQ